MKKGVVAVLVVIFLVVGFVGGYYVGGMSTQTNKSTALSVFSAGSLKYALGEFNPSFDNATGVNSGVTFAGSVTGANEIISGESFDIYVTASAGLIPQKLIPNYTSWMVIFASNEMAITWDNAKYNISPNSFWFENISAPGVTVALSNASLDPSGFQAIETVKLAGILYTQYHNNTVIGQYVREAWRNNSSLYAKYNKAWNDWFGPGGTLATDGSGGNYPYNDSQALYDQLFVYNLAKGNLKLTTEEIGLDSFLSSGAADYAITYKSQAISQSLYYFKNSDGSNGLSPWINLGSLGKGEVSFYKEINASGPRIDNIGDMPGAPILYGATILTTSHNDMNAQLFIYYLVSTMGEHYLSISEFDPLEVPYVYGNAPLFLDNVAQVVPSYLVYSFT